MNERSLSNCSTCSSLKHAYFPSFQNLLYPYSFDTSLQVSLLLHRLCVSADTSRTLCAECRPTHAPTGPSPFLPSCLTEPSSSKCKRSRLAAQGLCSPNTQLRSLKGRRDSRLFSFRPPTQARETVLHQQRALNTTFLHGPARKSLCLPQTL